MRYAVLLALLVSAAAGCAKNRESEESGATGAGARANDTTRMRDSSRIHDTTLTPRDSTRPSDTLPHIRDSVPDSTRNR
jgi:hypothetical protein